MNDAASLGIAEPLAVNLSELARLPLEEALPILEGCKVAVVCPNADDDSPEALDGALRGLKALLSAVPYELTKIVLLSRVGAQSTKGGFNLGGFFGESKGASWDDLEDELTKTARLRPASRPLRTILVRVGAPPAEPAPEGLVRTCPVDGATEGSTSQQVAAEAVFQALTMSV